MHKVCIIGSGNFGSTIAKVIGENIPALSDFDKTVRVYVWDEKVVMDGVEYPSLVKIFNERHENVKYLPGVRLPDNVVAIGDVVEACEGCDFLVFVTPHQFLRKPLEAMRGHIPPNATGLSLVKGVTMQGDKIFLVTDLVTEVLGIPCGALMGANIANDIAKEEFCESTIAFDDPSYGQRWFPLINNSYFRIKIIDDLCLQQLCGTVKNIVALGGGFVDGLGYGQNTKAAILRIGLEEMYNFAKWYFPERNPKLETMLESCGVADMIATAYGGRNHRCAVEFVKSGDDITEVEKRELNGQKLQGNIAAQEMFQLLKARNAIHKFPLMVTVYMIITKQVPPDYILHYDGPHLDDAK